MAMIHHLERDYGLKLEFDEWGSGLLAMEKGKERGWQEEKGGEARYLHRELTVKKGRELKGRGYLKEHIVRFPSAPVYGTNRKSDYGIEVSRVSTHTLRVLTDPKREDPVNRLFIFHNGLNEAENLRFYYRFANWILDEDRRGSRSACLVVPFPGHLTHSSFSGLFAQTPLVRYLNDSGELFRQFLRYMIEMRWLLSAVNRKIPDKWMVGWPPHAKTKLPEKLRSEYRQLRRASRSALELSLGKRLNKEKQDSLLGEEIELGTIEAMFGALDDALGRGNGDGEDMVSTHVIGYSLGGFLAQCVFFAWPNMVSSCATICSGGAIRALSPTAFAHPEEWQAVLHTLRPELEEAMMSGRIARKGKRIAGMPDDLFAYYQRVFDQVFLQEDHASYKARLSEYGMRMVFIGGGDDPIVKPREVLDAGPKEGITMLSVANLTHFLGEDARSEQETAQREFWLPESGGLIARAAVRAEELHDEERKAAIEKNSRAKLIEKESKKAANAKKGKMKAKQIDERKERREKKEEEGALPKQPTTRDLESPDFESALDWVIDGVKPDGAGESGEGWLFICRNGLPAAFLNAEMQRAWATGLRHHDVLVQQYAEGLTCRAADLRVIAERMTLVLPHDLRKTFVELSGELVDPHSDAPGYRATKARRGVAWDKFRNDWEEQTRWFQAGFVSKSLRPSVSASQFASAVGTWQGVPSEHLRITHVPDVWIAIKDVEGLHPSQHNAAAQHLLDRVIRILNEEQEAREKAESEGERYKLPASEGGKMLEREIKDGRIRIVKVSATELNPRYRGRFEKGLKDALLLLAHCAAALVRSKNQPEKPVKGELEPAGSAN